MPYLFNTDDDRKAMLQAIGVASIEELLEQVPPELRLKAELDLPPALTEIELTRQMSALANQNDHAGKSVCFLGGGSYDHFVPAVVDAIAGRGEFFTSYTPYQPEVSQGNLQVMFEYQTLICELTGMDVSNASLYDGGTAAIEAVLLCMSSTKRHGKVVVLESVHPEYREIIGTYLQNLGGEVVTVPASSGAAGLAEVEAAVDDQTACVLVQHPNFFGCLEDVAAIAEIAHKKGAMLVQAFDPISLGLLKSPGALGADVAIAEGQSLGNPLAFGGPYLGIMACKEEFVRRMPGRIAGETTSAGNRRCFVLTLQTREQHIRREKATSNICTNQGLLALRASIYLAAMGPSGLKEAADLCVRKSHYAAEVISASDRFSLAFEQPMFKEFVVRDEQGEVSAILEQAQEQGILAGVPLSRWYPQLTDCFLVAFTEKRTRNEIDAWARCLTGSANIQPRAVHA